MSTIFPPALLNDLAKLWIVFEDIVFEFVFPKMVEDRCRPAVLGDNDILTLSFLEVVG